MLATLLRRFEPFAALEWSTLCSVARHARLLRCAAQRTLAPTARSRRGSCYIVKGTVLRRDKGGRCEQISAEDAAARRPLLVVGDGASIETVCAATLLWIDVDPVAFMLGAGDPSGYGVEPMDASDGHWMHHFLGRGVADALPPDALQAVFRAFTPVTLAAGETIVRLGDAADAFFVLADGCAEVRRCDRRVATLVPGDTFGADALVGGTVRNATVVMATDGRAMGLRPAAFERLLSERLVRWIDAPAPGCLTIDLSARDRGPDALRALVGELDLGAVYAFCGGDVGERALAAFLASQRGVRAFVRI